jgi:hypothetical protein
MGASKSALQVEDPFGMKRAQVWVLSFDPGGCALERVRIGIREGEDRPDAGVKHLQRLSLEVDQGAIAVARQLGLQWLGQAGWGGERLGDLLREERGSRP